jgi:type I restriction enzyme M protein
MARNSEFSSYVFIKNDLGNMGWNTKNPSRADNGQLYTQQECLDHPEIAAGLKRQRPEYVVKVHEDVFWVIEAKATHEQIDDAFNEALGYAKNINKSKLIKARLITGVAGNDDDGYLVSTAFLQVDGQVSTVKYNKRKITGFLSP